MVFASLFNDAATAVGLMAGSIAVGGFLAHAHPALFGADEETVRFMTVFGGLGGLIFAVLILLIVLAR